MELLSARPIASVGSIEIWLSGCRAMIALAACLAALAGCSPDPESVHEQPGHWQMFAYDQDGKTIGEARAELKTPKQLRTRLAQFCTDTGAKRILARALAGGLEYDRTCEQVYMRSARDQRKR